MQSQGQKSLVSAQYRCFNRASQVVHDFPLCFILGLAAGGVCAPK